MQSNLRKRDISRKRRVFRVRNKLNGTEKRPRMSVFKSNKHLFVQLIDDENAKVIVAAGTYSKESKARKSKETALELGKKIATLAKSKNVNEVIFDRGRYKYHGIIANLADSARDAGLKF